MRALEVPTRQQIEVGDQTAHRRIEPIGTLQLQGKALGQITGEQAGRVKGLAADEGRCDLLLDSPKTAGDFRNVSAKIAGLVEAFGEFMRNQPFRRIGDAEGDLFDNMIAQCQLCRRNILEVETLGNASG